MNERWKWTLRCSFQCWTERIMCQGKVYTQFSFLYFDRSVRKGSFYNSSNDFPLSKDQPTWLWPLCSVDSMKNMSVRSLQQLRVQKWAPVATSFSSICWKMRDRLSQGGQQRFGQKRLRPNYSMLVLGKHLLNYYWLKFLADWCRNEEQTCTRNSEGTYSLLLFDQYRHCSCQTDCCFSMAISHRGSDKNLPILS